MKKLLSSLVVFSVLLVTGCQENTISDPVSTVSVKKPSETQSNAIEGTIPLNQILEVPGMFNTFYSLTGQINYVHEIYFVDPIPPAPQYYVQLNLDIQAVLTNLEFPVQNTWTVDSESLNVFYVSEEGIYLLEKSFPILGRSDGLVLVCRFLVTTDGIGLNSIWLTLTNDLINN